MLDLEDFFLYNTHNVNKNYLIKIGLAMIDKKQQITDMAEIMYEEFVKMKKSLDGFEEMSLYNTDKHYLTDEYKEGFIAGIKCLSSILFFL